MKWMTDHPRSMILQRRKVPDVSIPLPHLVDEVRVLGLPQGLLGVEGAAHPGVCRRCLEDVGAVDHLPSPLAPGGGRDGREEKGVCVEICDKAGK